MIRLKRRYERRALIDITSLIDLVFLLVAFFMVTSRIGSESSINVNLPSSSSSAQERDETMVVSVTKENRVFINDEPVQVKDLAGRFSTIKKSIEGKRVVIRGDKNANYNTIIQVMDALNQSGLSRFTLSTVK